jgi:hypothetical protein
VTKIYFADVSGGGVSGRWFTAPLIALIGTIYVVPTPKRGL